jgi:hypothetical protein
MERKPSQTIGQMSLFLWLTSLCVHIHCIICMNVSLDSIPLAVLRQQTRKQESCFQNLHIGESKAESCGKNIYYPEIKTVRQNHKICFTDTKQSHFDKGNRTKNTTLSVRGCQILHQEEITNVVNISCSWLEQGYQKLDKDHILLAVVLRCNSTRTKQQQQQLCLIIAASRSLADTDGDVGMDSCLSDVPRGATSEPTPPTSNSKGSSFLDYIKEYMTPVLAVLGGVLFIIMVFVANRIRKRHISSRDEPSETEAEESNTNQEGGLYHEPNHTYIDIDSEESRPRNYAYAYGHFEPTTPTSNVHANTLESGKRHNYMNITQLPDRRKDDGADYMNVDKENDMDYMEMKSSYQTLDRSSMIDDNAMYQGLVQQKDRVRPKVAPKPSCLRRVEEPELSYVKVL